MHKSSLTIRFSMTVDRALAAYANSRGISKYEAASKAVELGLGAMIAPPSETTAEQMTAVLSEIGELSAAIKHIGALTDRALFTAVCAYVYAQRTALKGEADPSKINQALAAEAAEAYSRQKKLAQKTLTRDQS